jgi:uncharacterized RmlC-like cupin family protein
MLPPAGPGLQHPRAGARPTIDGGGTLYLGGRRVEGLWMKREPIVVRPDEGIPGPATAGMERRTLFDRDGRWAGWIRTDAGVSGGWHHHGGHDSYIYVLAGSLTMDFGPGGRESVQAGPGDFIFNPAHVIHRETTSPDGEVEAFVLRVGEGPQVVNVDGPDES